MVYSPGRSIVIVGFNVSCGSEPSPGLDDNRWDWFRLSFKFPEMDKTIYIDVPIKGDFDGGGKNSKDRGDTNRVIAARVKAAISHAKGNGTLPYNAPIYVETSPDPANPNTAPGRIVVYGAIEVNAGCTNAKLKFDIFDPTPTDYKKQRAKVVTPRDPPPRPTPGDPNPPKAKGPTTPSDPPGEKGTEWPSRGKGEGPGPSPAKFLGDNPESPPFDPKNPVGVLPGDIYSAPLRTRFDGGGWLPAGSLILGRIGLPSGLPGLMAGTMQIPFPYAYDSAARQAAIIASSLRFAGIHAESSGEDIFIDPPDDPFGLRFLGFSTGDNPLGFGSAFPWELALCGYSEQRGSGPEFLALSPQHPAGVNDAPVGVINPFDPRLTGRTASAPAMTSGVPVFNPVGSQQVPFARAPQPQTPRSDS